MKQAETGKLDEAVAAVLKALAIERRSLGDLHEDVVGSLEYLAWVHEKRDDWAAARTALTEVIAIRERQPNPKDWRIADARRALADIDRRVALNPAHRQRLREADRLDLLQESLSRQGKFAEGLEPCRKVMEVRRELLGENHPVYINSVTNLAAHHQLLLEYAKAEPLYRQALELHKRTGREDHPDYAGCLINLGSLHVAMGEYAKAEPLFRQALEIRKRALGENHPDYADCLNRLGPVYKNMGDYAKAEPLLRQALEIRKRALGENHPDSAGSLINLANLYKLMGANAKAEPLYVHALKIEKRTLGENHPDYAIGLSNLAELYKAMGANAKAEPLYRNALEIRKRALGENHPDYAQGLNNLGALYAATGDYAKAEPLFRQALEIRKRALGENHPDYADSLESLALLYQQMGDYAQSEPLQRRALEIRKHALGQNHPSYASGLNNLGGLYAAMGDYAKAEPLRRQALEIRKWALGENHPDFAGSLNDLANQYHDTGQYAKEEPLRRRALEIRKHSLGESHPDYASSLNNLGALYQVLGDFAKAEPLYRRALEIRKKALGESHPDYGASLFNLGALYGEMGNLAKAEPLQRQALETYKRAVGENRPDYANCLNDLGWLYQAMGDYARAEPIIRRALEIRKQALGENHPDYARSLNNLAGVYLAMGDYVKAEPLNRQALEIYKRALGENHPHYAGSLTNLATLFYCQGQFAAAEQFLRQGLTLLTEWTWGGLATLGERQRIRLLAGRRRALDFYLSVAPAAGIRSEEIYRHVLAWKGIAESLQDEDRLAREQPELQGTFRQLEQARSRLAHLAFAIPPAGQRQNWLQQLDALRDHKEDLEGELSRKSGEFRRARETRRLGAAEVGAVLPPGSVLVDLFDYIHTNRPVSGREAQFRGEQRLAAFLLRRDQAPVHVSLGASRPIEEAVQSWRQALDAGNPWAMQAAALELNRLVWEPLKPHVEGATNVLVAPDGPLSVIPLAALPGRQPGTYLLEDVAIGYVSSAHRLVETLGVPREAKPKGPEPAAGLLAIGGIDYQAEPGGAAPSESAPTPRVLLADSRRAGFRALAGTEPEARRISQLFDAAFPQQHALVLTGAAPTEAAVKQQLSQHWRYLHLATHGFFESPTLVAAVRAGLNSDGFGLTGIGSSEESAILAMSPLLHSGVALVGAGRKTEDAGPAAQGRLPEREDGILTAEEVQSLDLRGTEMVVLSACETGLGKGEYGQGVMGLERAFQGAGTRAVMASLWRVDDAATTVLMEQFYTNLWTKKMSKLEALRQAQLTVLNNPGLVIARQAELAKRRGIGEKAETVPGGGAISPPSAGTVRSNPALWAAFVLSGDVR